MSNSNTVLLESSSSGIANIILNRPEKRNAFNLEVIETLSDIFDHLAKNNQVRIIIIKGAGSCFCAGADLAWMRQQGQESIEKNQKDATFFARLFYKLSMLPQATIGLAHGAVIGGGLGLLAACDMAFAVDSTKMSFSEVKLGLIPASIAPYIIKAIGVHKANTLFVSADTFTAKTAKQIGLIYQTAKTKEELEQMVDKYAKRLLQNAPGAIFETKKLILELSEKITEQDKIELVSRKLAERRASKEALEGVEAFFEKRLANWVK